ncbi:MAG: DUF4352 domain-containing protein [Actinomycetota bacterium]
MKKIVMVLGCIGLLAGLMLACSSDPATKVGTTGTSTTPAKPTTFKVGDQIKLGDRVLTVEAPVRNVTDPDGYLNPDEGKEWVTIAVTIENKGSEAVSFNPYDFKMQDSSGTRLNIAFVPSVQNQLHSGEVAPGGKTAGVLPFQVPASDTGLKLVFKPFWGSETLITLQ